MKLLFLLIKNSGFPESFITLFYGCKGNEVKCALFLIPLLLIPFSVLSYSEYLKNAGTQQMDDK